MELVHLKRDFGIVQIAFCDQPFWEQCDREGREGPGRGLCGFWSRGRARGRNARVSWLMDEEITDSGLSIKSKRGFATGVMVPGIDVHMTFRLAGVALQRAFFAIEDSVELERNCLLKDLNRYKIKQKRLKMLISEKNAAMKVIFTCLLDVERRVATFETEKRLLTKYNLELLSFARLERAKSLHTGDNFIKIISLMYLGFSLPVEKAIVQN